MLLNYDHCAKRYTTRKHMAVIAHYKWVADTLHLGRPRAVTPLGGRVSIGIFSFSIFHFTTLRVIRAFLLHWSRPKNIGVVG